MSNARPVLITGAFRSGTSLVAAVVHRLGWQIAPSIPPPAPPSWRSDYEDPQFTIRLMRGERPATSTLRMYAAQRRAYSKATGFNGRIALKSAYLVFVWTRLLEALPDAFVIRIRREDSARRASLVAHHSLNDLGHDFAILEGLNAVRPHLDVWYEAVVERPEEFVRTVAQALGVQDDAAVTAATAMIGKPTEY